MESEGYDVIDNVNLGHDAALMFCETETDWESVAVEATRNPTAVVLPQLSVDLIAQALRLGAGAVHIDTSTEIIVDVHEAAMSGEALMPLTVAQHLAQRWVPMGNLLGLSSEEQVVAESLAAGTTIQQLADTLGYSDRTIRRKLQGISLKIGATDRYEAIRILQAQLAS